ncbi:DMT family transporter [Celeribacter persicus]|jgi:Predicted permeases|uniref:EamA domain-containing membrane protein RarD n=1 Tax=Celeribacter persicus TaxID=1651082 RepID=A0A2T5HK36_9RHOB|nr:DMT family transporter [Celeribacter persicus]PTQ71935.1 EamA domain-containing membrane protein RarD [Celeribacter persicus]
MSTQSHPLKAALWMSGALLGFSAMAVAGRKLAGHLDTFEILGYRSFFGLLIVLAVALPQRRLAEFRPKAMALHIGRNLGHFAGQNLWLYALTLIPMAQLFALEFSYPILVGLGATLFLGEKMTPTRALTSVMGFVGILIVARPFGGALSIGLIAAMLCAFGFAASALFTKRLTLTAHVSVLSIMFWMVTLQLIFGLVCAFADGHAVLPRLQDVPWVIVVAISGLGAHFCLTTALSLAPASIVTPIDFLRLPIIAVIGMAFYGEGIDIWVFIGAAIIFSANYINILSENRRMARLSSPA